ncbi:hypothetical protein BKA67DRAFT_659563 [Truncatella angustata]|uniref:Ubiquitin 3 binding protein But2 C-terminal domain-containing protein n=1 Tax=Truncatella angustata TaxID=152316 RepID=A0A9P8UIU8_9PEZI|nr:uncharacterized protein BKA67DRAFT_659563 [Truncatella angustata]KAH6652904.1 hypothetical protein BKA67DRAFT_659563 [Truncatella angustata]KAH8197219.1 hypothetical protein TruAng_008606 [Truncatella angustata]
MYFTSIVVSALAAAGLASASPASRGSKRGPCLSQPPSSIGFPINYNISSASSPFASFLIPPNSVGPCTLVAKFPAGYPVSTAGNPLVDFVDVNGPAAGSVVGTAHLQSSPTQATKTFINSFACRDVMAYQLKLAPQEGSNEWVAFQEIQGVGLFMEVGDSC